MIFWILSALVTAAVIALILRPILESENEKDPTSEADLAIYRDQLAEIKRDKTRGILSEEEAEAAEIEVSRRILTAADKFESQSETPTQQLSDRSRIWISGVAAVAVTVTALASYLSLGSPGLPGQPHAERAKMDPRNLPVTELIARVEAQLQANPDDARGWDVIAPVYLRQKDYQKAIHAFQRTLALNGENPRRLAQYAESILGATNGLVNETVKTTYDKLLKLRPDYYPARFWLAVRHEQLGQSEEAAAAYKRLLSETDLPGQMRAMVRQRFIAVSGGPPPAARSGPAEATDKAGQNGAGRAPALSKDAREAMAALTPQQRQQQIRQMVEGLAERLRSDGGSLDEWQRLIRAYSVLDDRDNATKALSDARASLQKQPEQLQQLNTFAKTLNLN